MRAFPKKLTSIFCFIVLSLLIAHLASQALKFHGGHEVQLGWERQLNLNEENNIPSWYASSTLFLCSMLLGMIGWAKRRERAPYAVRWLALAGIFLYLSMDEAASLHEMTMPFGYRLLDRAGLFTGYFHYSWVIFGMGAVGTIGLLYLPFLRDLPRTTRRWFLVAGSLYVGGAIGVELFGGKIDAQGGRESMQYAVLVAAEEGFEMFGVIAFIYALLSYMVREDIAASLVRLSHAVIEMPATGSSPSNRPSGNPSRSEGRVA